MIPCDPIKYLDIEYGPSNWLTPKSANYTWKNVIYSDKWTNEEWKRVIRYYHSNGNLNLDKTLTVLNKQIDFNLTDLPKD